MIVVLTGAPGAGKGTQADLLVERLGYRKVSTGDALRKHIKGGTPIGKKAEAIVASGKLVPDDVLFEILKTELGTDSSDKILLDGYPRNVSQAETLSGLETLHPVAVAIHLDVNRDELIERLTGRRVCSKCGKSYHVTLNPTNVDGVCDACGGGLIQRVDDKPDKVKVRLNVYEEQTEPVLGFYKGKKLYQRVHGEGSQEDVFERIKEVLDRTSPSKNKH